MNDKRKFVAPAEEQRSNDKRKSFDTRPRNRDDGKYPNEKKQRLRDVSRIASPDRGLSRRRDRSRERKPAPAAPAFGQAPRHGLFYVKDNFFDFLTRCLSNVSDEIRKVFPASHQKETNYILSSATPPEMEIFRNDMRGRNELIHSYLLVRELPPCVFYGSGFGTKEFLAKTAAAKDLVEKCGKVGLITEDLYTFVDRENNLEKVVQHRDYSLAVRALARFDAYMKQYNWPHDIFIAREVDELAIRQLREIFDKVKQEIYIIPLDRGAPPTSSSSESWDSRNPFCNRCNTRGHLERDCRGLAPREERWVNRDGPLARDFGAFNSRPDNRPSDSWLQDGRRNQPAEVVPQSRFSIPKIPEHEIERRILEQREELLKKERVRGMIEPIDNFDPSGSWKDPPFGAPLGLIPKSLPQPALQAFSRSFSTRTSEMTMPHVVAQHPYFRPPTDKGPSTIKRPLLSMPSDSRSELEVRKAVEEELKVKMEAERLKKKEEELERREQELETERKRLQDEVKRKSFEEERSRIDDRQIDAYRQKPLLDHAPMYASNPANLQRSRTPEKVATVNITPYGYAKPDSTGVPYGYNSNRQDNDDRVLGGVSNLSSAGYTNQSGATGYNGGHLVSSSRQVGLTYGSDAREIHAGTVYGGMGHSNELGSSLVDKPPVDYDLESINFLVKEIEEKLLQLQKNGQHSTLNAIFDSRAMQTVARLGDSMLQLSKEQKEELLHDLRKLIVEAEFNLQRGSQPSFADSSLDDFGGRPRSRSSSSSPSRSRSPMKPSEYREIRVKLGSTVLRNMTPYEQQSLKLGDNVVAQDIKSGQWKSGKITKIGPLRVSMQVGVSTWKKHKSELYCDLYGSSRPLI